MKYYRTALILTIILIFGVILLSCGTSKNPVVSTKELPNPIDSVATDITLIVYSDGWGTALDTILLATEGEVVISIEEASPFYDPAQYYIYASAAGFYTEIYKCVKGETIDVDLDAVPQFSNLLTGVIFSTQAYFSDCYLVDHLISLTKVGGNSISSKTDAQGRFAFPDLEEGHYLLHFSYMELPISFDVYNSVGTDYRELTFLEPMQVDAPNIYLYPESTSNIQVTVSFPEVGKIILSEPEYNNGWDVSVTENGIIDGQYEYLFYEAMLSQPTNNQIGWLFARSDLETEFRNILADYGCVGREIDDFIEFWIPRLDYAPWFAVYPQDVEAMIHLDITPQPESLLRLIFLIRGVNQEIAIVQPPTPEKFIRDKFTVVEWGAIELK